MAGAALGNPRSVISNSRFLGLGSGVGGPGTLGEGVRGPLDPGGVPATPPPPPNRAKSFFTLFADEVGLKGSSVGVILVGGAVGGAILASLGADLEGRAVGGAILA